jgi:hypothetical protein
VDASRLGGDAEHVAYFRRLHGVDALLLPVSQRALRPSLDALAGALLGSLRGYVEFHVIRPANLATLPLQR